MNPNLLRLLTALAAGATAITGLGAYTDLLPDQYAKIAGIVLACAITLKEFAVRAGDIADDGEINGSFKPDPKKFFSILFFAACTFLCGGHLTSCSNTAQEALKKRAEEAALEVGKQAAIVSAEGTLNWLRKELKTLEAKPVDEDPYQQLIDQNRISALKAAIKSGEEQLAKLRAPSAKQPINPNPSAQSSVLSAQLNPTSAVFQPLAVQNPKGARALLPASFHFNDFNDRENRYSSESHKLASDGSTPSPVTNHPTHNRERADWSLDPVPQAKARAARSQDFPKLGIQVAAHLASN